MTWDVSAIRFVHQLCCDLKLLRCALVVNFRCVKVTARLFSEPIRSDFNVYRVCSPGHWRPALSLANKCLRVCDCLIRGAAIRSVASLPLQWSLTPTGAKRMVEMAVEGYPCTIFCYGQTGSGKTHTLTGPPHLVSSVARHSVPTPGHLCSLSVNSLSVRTLQRTADCMVWQATSGHYTECQFVSNYLNACQVISGHLMPTRVTGHPWLWVTTTSMSAVLRTVKPPRVGKIVRFERFMCII